MSFIWPNKPYKTNFTNEKEYKSISPYSDGYCGQQDMANNLVRVFGLHAVFIDSMFAVLFGLNNVLPTLFLFFNLQILMGTWTVTSKVKY